MEFQGGTESDKTIFNKLEEFDYESPHLNALRQRHKEEVQTKVRGYWKLLQNSIHNATKLVTKADIKDILISHGVHHGRKLNHVNEIKQVIQNPKTKEFITLDGKLLRMFHKDGRKKDIIEPEEPFQRMVFAHSADLYVGWTPNDNHLVLMSNTFNVHSVATAQEGPIDAAVYNSCINEVVTSGPGYVTSWVFRYGNRHILPRKITRYSLPEGESFNILVLEETASRAQKCFAANGTNVAVVNVFSGKVLDYKKELHVRNITAMLFFNPLKYLITASKDGSIKVWNDKWHLQLVFVGHDYTVTSLAIYPFGPCIMSSSLDNTIRVWSLETCDEVDIIKTEDHPVFLGTNIQHEVFFSLSSHHIDLWVIQLVHSLHTSVGYRVECIDHTNHPCYPIRSVIQCRDSSVRLLAPSSGNVITTLLNDPRRGLVDCAYAIAHDEIFAVFKNGDIVKASTLTNPCTVLEEWKCTDPKESCNFLLVYEYVFDDADLWGAMKRAINTNTLGVADSMDRDTPKEKKAPQNMDRTLLLGGRKDGYICKFNWDTGKVDFKIEAHGSKGVLSMVANSKIDQLISAGKDNIIKVWRLYPYAEEALAPLMSFYCAHTPIHMTIMKTKLFVAFQEHATATYSVVLYNLTNKNRSDHSPDDDHVDSIVGLACCQRMKLFSSASTDGSIRIWDESNHLVKLIKLNATPHSIGFCSQKGDLIVGIGKHLHYIDHNTYLPKAYKNRQVSMTFPHEQEEEPIPYDDALLENLRNDDIKRLKASHSSFKFTHFVDILTEEETEEVMKEKRHKEKMFKILEDRDNELMQIRDGKLESKRKPKKTKKTKNEAFNKYMKIFYNRPDLKVPKEEEFPDDALEQFILERDGGTKVEEEAPWEPEREPTGFFPPPSSAIRTDTELLDQSNFLDPSRGPTFLTEPKQSFLLPELPIKEQSESASPAPPMTPKPQFVINPNGFIPNSILVKLLWPEEVKEDLETSSEYRPPSLTAEQMAQIEGLNNKQFQTREWGKNKRKGSGASSKWDDQAKVLDYADSEAEEPENLEPPKSAFLDKIQDVLDRPPTPKSEPESPVPQPVDKSLGTNTPRPPPSPPKAPRGPAKKPMKPIVKYVAAVPPPRERTPTPPPTPLPEFISKWMGEEWFEKYFPNANSNTMPKPWTIQAFITMLLRLVRIASFKHKSDVVEAILRINQDFGVPNNDAVLRTLLSVLNHHTHPPTCAVPEEKMFILSAIKCMQSMGIFDKDFCTGLMVEYIEGDKDIRQIVRDAFAFSGLNDPHDHFGRDMDSWDTWNVSEDNRKPEIKNMCELWLDKWLATFKIHLEDSIERLKKGQSVHGNVNKLRKNMGDGEAKSLSTMTIDKVPSHSMIQKATFMDAINYFCEMALQKEIEQMYKERNQDKVVNSKNTVLVLPKLSLHPPLVRLGELHTSKCKPHRETAYAIDKDFSLPPITSRGHQPPKGVVSGFAPAINLPMKQVYINPFPSPADVYLHQEPILLTLKSSQKYFIPAQSYINDFEQFI
ncbi:unnamed protein product [Owenia fusiformis]|uniref:Uncharacterized protein n=1 Tax=Owenia fusiformis TaxID=6347 RepID=A0A8J1TU70_OWEFU|nr:unnamed protein product [Owenia fusiformis]